MIDTIYQILKTIINKELRGNMTPEEFNKIAKQVQDEIFTEYFGDNNLQQNRFNRGLTNKNHANLPKLIRQKIARFHEQENLVYNVASERFNLPDSIYYIEDNGLLFSNNVIEEMTSADFGYMASSSASPSTTFPVYENYEDSVKVYPDTIQENVSCRFLRKPADPKWTYTSVGNVELFDDTIADYQDFEVHVSELPNIVINMASYFGINLRESDLAQYFEALKQKEEIKEQQQ